MRGARKSGRSARLRRRRLGGHLWLCDDWGVVGLSDDVALAEWSGWSSSPIEVPRRVARTAMPPEDELDVRSPPLEIVPTRGGGGVALFPSFRQQQFRIVDDGVHAPAILVLCGDVRDSWVQEGLAALTSTPAVEDVKTALVCRRFRLALSPGATTLRLFYAARAGREVLSRGSDEPTIDVSGRREVVLVVHHAVAFPDGRCVWVGGTWLGGTGRSLRRRRATHWFLLRIESPVKPESAVGSGGSSPVRSVDALLQRRYRGLTELIGAQRQRDPTASEPVGSDAAREIRPRFAGRTWLNEAVGGPAVLIDDRALARWREISFERRAAADPAAASIAGACESAWLSTVDLGSSCNVAVLGRANRLLAIERLPSIGWYVVGLRPEVDDEIAGRALGSLRRFLAGHRPDTSEVLGWKRLRTSRSATDVRLWFALGNETLQPAADDAAVPLPASCAGLDIHLLRFIVDAGGNVVLLPDDFEDPPSRPDGNAVAFDVYLLRPIAFPD